MNAPPVEGTRGRQGGGAWMRGLALLQASHGSHGRGLAMLLYALLAALGVLLSQIARRPERGLVALVAIVGMATAVVWALWFARLALLHIEAREAHVPALVRDLPHALGVALLASVLVPALGLAALGASPGFALQVLLVGALSGLSLALLPVGAYTALSFTPLVLVLLKKALTTQFGPGLWTSLDFHPGRADLPWLLLGLSLLAIWRWRVVVAAGKAAHTSPWGRPLIAAQRGPMLWMTGVDADPNLWRAHLPEWLWPSGKATAGPAQPLHAMRIWLGNPFAPLHARQRWLQLVLIAGLFLVMALGAVPDDGSRLVQSGMVGGLIGGVGGGVIVMVSMYAWRLEQMRRASAGELAELALLPGWGDTAHARRALLLRAVAYAPLRAWGLIGGVLLGAAALVGLPSTGLLLLVSCLVVLALTTAMACLRPLAGQPLMHWWPLLLLGAALLLTTVCLVVYGPHPERSPGAVAFLLCALVALATLAALRGSWSRFSARTHPFLQD